MEARLPHVPLERPKGGTRRLYDPLPGAGPALLDVAEGRAFAERLPVADVVRVGPGGYRDPTERLRGLLGGRSAGSWCGRTVRWSFREAAEPLEVDVVALVAPL